MKRISRDELVQQRYRTFEPVATVTPGETVVVETINHMTPVVQNEGDLHHYSSPDYRERRETGPIAVEGLEPGGMLAVRIEQIDIVGIPHAIGAGPLHEQYPQEPLLFPVENGRCLLPGGVSVPELRMVGDIYTTPAEEEPKFCDHGGNMDFCEVCPGNTLYLPVFRSGALLVLGDVHALQGDGELYGEAAETAADVTLTLDAEERIISPRPVVETSDRLITLASRESFHESVRLAVADMVALLVRLHGMTEKDAYVVASMAGSVRMAGCLFWRGRDIDNYIVGLSVPRNLRA